MSSASADDDPALLGQPHGQVEVGHGVGEVGGGQVRPVEPGAPQVRAPQPRPPQDRAGQVRAR